MANYKNTLMAGAVGVLLSITAAPSAHAQFNFNWAEQGDVNAFFAGSTSFGFARCNRNRSASGNCINGFGDSLADPDRTPFLQERIRGSDGQLYYHLIVGMEDSAFRQESYIRAGGTDWSVLTDDQVKNAANNGFACRNANLGPEVRCFEGGPGSSSAGRAGALQNRTADYRRNQAPLSNDENINGTGTGNPNRVLLHQVNEDGDMFQEFFKSEFESKPVITQRLNNDQLNAEVVLDMTNSTYDEMNTPGSMTNTFNLASGGLNVGGADFDMAQDAQQTGVTAGMFQWLPGDNVDNSFGTYEYAPEAAELDIYEVDWQNFRNADENPPSKNLQGTP